MNGRPDDFCVLERSVRSVHPQKAVHVSKVQKLKSYGEALDRTLRWTLQNTRSESDFLGFLSQNSKVTRNASRSHHPPRRDLEKTGVSAHSQVESN